MTDPDMEFDADIYGGVNAEDIPDLDELLEPEIPEGAESLAEPNYAQPDLDIAKGKSRTRRSTQYQKKVKRVLASGFRMTAGNPNTQADAATILLYGKGFAEAAGDLADSDEWAAKAIDFFTDTTENTKLTFAMVAGVMTLQIIRNHEPILEPAQRGIKIPFTKGKRRINFRFGIKLGRMREITHEPSFLVQSVFNNPKIQASLKRQGINVPPPNGRKR